METYSDVIEYLFARLPMFTRDGATAIKKDIGNTLRLCNLLDNPQNKFKSIHIAGTNGKGSSSHMLASILAKAGYKTGLYTSPHLLDFRERIRVNGEMISEGEVIAFVKRYKNDIEEICPSFFEVTVAMAFDHFAKEQVDIAIVEVGLGGRLDSTNIINPELSLITNIGLDHIDLLGNTLEEIAREKAGIIKKEKPVVLSERDNLIFQVFEDKSNEMKSPLRVAADELEVVAYKRVSEGLTLDVKKKIDNAIKTYYVGLSGLYQRKNVLGVLTAIDELRNQGWKVYDEAVNLGLRDVRLNTGLQGRWQVLSENPYIICDTGHNEDGIREVVENLASISYKQLHIVLGAMRDKDLSHMLPLLPSSGMYYFCSPSMPRAMPAKELKAAAERYGLKGVDYGDVGEAISAAKAAYSEQDMIFIGGSNFVVAEALHFFK
ncbi:bifunctional folylpolyglutamate synthase/dihydrofolate synthase [Sphingobacterium sp. UT-1RO-CII-1]|uniref:bifunctional folylpolyglutamate synthase/dihydrofolate synthase n=1 Tax=Sphingobacterium sp. UT-1RO-CII-1 TaxID=2995225 RepID=UPI00227C1279|nr:folylpolyglutamate synthase/dihydrofolate synthase family protein [Sphingobacterium sp. UT-1RO-CII-1]MCY4779915.1 bifunctional folylpolyglutamate synthase/dihydrofolate synthase [Sphingobacterium sp. UT-1RO-CII-1]